MWLYRFPNAGKSTFISRVPQQTQDCRLPFHAYAARASCNMQTIQICHCRIPDDSALMGMGMGVNF
jgi:hypothetical protein